MAESVLTGLFFLYGTIANRVSDAAASVITRILTRNLLPVLVTVTLAFALLWKITGIVSLNANLDGIVQVAASNLQTLAN